MGSMRPASAWCAFCLCGAAWGQVYARDDLPFLGHYSGFYVALFVLVGAGVLQRNRHVIAAAISLLGGLWLFWKYAPVCVLQDRGFLAYGKAHVRFADNSLTTPKRVTTVSLVTPLTWRGEGCGYVHPGFGRFSRLARLDLAGANRLRALPHELGVLTRLRDLDLSYNLFTALPAVVTRMRGLQYLSARDNLMRELPSALCDLDHLITLDLSGNRLHRLPVGFWNLPALREVDLSANALACLPAFTEACELQKLSAFLNRLHELPQGIGNAAHLEKLDISYNDIAFLSPEIGELKSLHILDASGNRLTSLPKEIRWLGSLRVLKLNDNCLAVLPPAVLALADLEELHLVCNELTHLPSELARLTALKLLVLSGNRISEDEQNRIPEWLPSTTVVF